MRSALGCVALAVCVTCGDGGNPVTPMDAATTDAAETLVDASIDGPTDAPHPGVTLFVTDSASERILRFKPTAEATSLVPEHMLAVADANAPLYVPELGELLVGDVAAARIYRFENAFTTPTPSGAIVGEGLAPVVCKLAMIDGQLWAANPSVNNVDRIAFNAIGTPTMAGSVPATSSRGIVFDAKRRHVLITECCGTDSIRRYALAANGTATALPSVTMNGLSNPHGMVVTPWDELLVANAGLHQVLRFAIDQTGNLTPLTALSGNGLSTPIDLVLMPWNELYVTNANGTISRFRIDATTHAITARDNLVVAGAQNLVWLSLYD